jgi:hypothetical protein
MRLSSARDKAGHRVPNNNPEHNLHDAARAEPLPNVPSPEIKFFFGSFDIGGLVTPMQSSSAAGGLLPIAPCGLTSL